MQSVLKQFEEKGTALLSGLFSKARIELTLIYAVILLFILGISSVITYSLFSNRLNIRWAEYHRPPRLEEITDINFPDEARSELALSLFIVNGVLITGAIGLSYILAGITLQPIQQTYNRQRRFLSDASHELRTPLAILQTDLENELDNTKASTQEKENSQSHLEEVRRMGKIVKDLLLISRLDGENQLSTPKDVVDLEEIVAIATKRLEGYARKHEVKIFSSPITRETPLVVIGNKEHLLQAVTNLIKNGIDYNNPNGKVLLSLKHDQKTAVVTVSDTGIGIAEEEIPKLFDRFYRVDQSRSREMGGSGLGLSIVQSVVHSYGGTVHISSKPGEGTTITLTFPLEA